MDAAPGIVQALGLQAVPTVIATQRPAGSLFRECCPAQVQVAIDQLLKAAVANGMADVRSLLVLNRHQQPSQSPKQIPGTPLPTRRWSAVTRRRAG